MFFPQCFFLAEGDGLVGFVFETGFPIGLLFAVFDAFGALGDLAEELAVQGEAEDGSVFGLHKLAFEGAGLNDSTGLY